MKSKSHPYSIKLVAIATNENDETEEYELERFDDYLRHERQVDVRRFFDEARPGVVSVHFEEDDTSYLFRLELIGEDDGQMVAGKYISFEDIEGYLAWINGRAGQGASGVQ